MMCPSCNQTVADDAAVCPKCDTVLDPSLLDAAPPEYDDAGDDTGAGAAPPPRPAARPAPRPGGPKRPASGARKPAAKRPARRPEAGPPPSAKPRDWRDDLSDEDKLAMARVPESAVFVPDKALDPDDLMGEAKRFIIDLSVADKLAFFGSVTMFLSCFFPWKETVREGDVLGLTSLGIVVFVLAGIAMAAIAGRVRTLFPKVNPLILWIGQLGAVSFAGVWCLIYMKLSIDQTVVRAPIGNEEIWASKPTFGVILALMSAGVASVGTVLGLKETGR
jgi:hypothetical protein